MAEECFKQARQKGTYNVTTKNATGIVCILQFELLPASFFSLEQTDVSIVMPV